MELRQKQVLRQLLIPELTQSLKILALPLLELKALVEQELISNPFLDESQIEKAPVKATSSLTYQNGFRYPAVNNPDWEFDINAIAQKTSLGDILIRQLGMFANSEEEFRIGQQIIESLDDNGYLKVSLEEIANSLKVSLEAAQKVLKIIQQFEPAGVAARSVSECLLIQLDLNGEQEPILRKIIEFYLDDVAKKNYSKIAKDLKIPPEEVEPLVKKILKFDPKPGRNYTSEQIQRVIPDIIIEDDGDEFDIIVYDKELPNFSINKEYKDFLKSKNIDPKDQEFLKSKLRSALELVRAVSQRQQTLKKIVEVVVQFQQEAIREGWSYLKPLGFKEVAQRLNIHETTVCRAVMNKYIKLPERVVALRDFFPSHVSDKNGQAISEVHIKSRIKELVENEDKKRPLSDQEISRYLLDKENLQISRRTISKYREEIRILCSTFRKQR